MIDVEVILIKNMVCQRCIMVVEDIFRQHQITPIAVGLGEIKVNKTELDNEKLNSLDSSLQKLGFERIDDKKSKILEKIKTIVIEAIHHQEQIEMTMNWSDYLSEKMNLDYHYLSSLFSSVSGTTLEQYIIKQKIEKVKEYLIYDELPLKEIAFRLGYSSIAHLSAQFKKVTVLTPSQFKEERSQITARKTLDAV
jgi:AraC-like DNA-binding protein